MTEQAHDTHNGPAGYSPPLAALPGLSIILRVGGDVTGLVRTLSAIRQQPMLPLEIIVVDQMTAGHVSTALGRFRDLPVLHVVHTVACDDCVGGYRLGLSLARGDLIGLPREAASDGGISRGGDAFVLGRAQATRLLDASMLASAPATRTRPLAKANRRRSRPRGGLPLLSPPAHLSAP
jgi:hypothetical protein